MLHDVELPEPGLVERVASRVYDVAQPVLLRQHEHGIQKTLHSFCRLDKRGPGAS